MARWVRIAVVAVVLVLLVQVRCQLTVGRRLLKFPAVTICNKNWFNLTRARRLLADVFPGNNCSDEDILRDDINAGSGCT
ncbi:hypothetical protein FJT64_022374 [Amphibalanus amphitrite]|uniref:Uncharacterized protein n=1 Tax=Amphibalanus amphitrite TaxID=1232801 RepID=A0A6A4WIZ4_AMPAM|nr:hypothetical protein FJT64_022374 [Amphibalanus amphitrite]